MGDAWALCVCVCVCVSYLRFESQRSMCAVTRAAQSQRRHIKHSLQELTVEQLGLVVCLHQVAKSLLVEATGQNVLGWATGCSTGGHGLQPAGTMSNRAVLKVLNPCVCVCVCV